MKTPDTSPTTMPVPTRWEHSPKTWAKRERFADILGKACAEQGVELQWLDLEKWTGVMRSSQGNHAPVYGYDLGLNSAASAKVADSKSDTYAQLRHHGIPAIPHVRITPNLTDGSSISTRITVEQAIVSAGLPMVLKPDSGQSSGKGVALCQTEQQVAAYLQEAHANKTVAAASPFSKFNEYRVVVLDGEARGVIEKDLAPGEWMHNQSKGSGRTLLDKQHKLHAPIGAFGVAAAAAIDLRFATIDVAVGYQEQEFAILEANDAVSMVYPNDSPIGLLAEEVYTDAITLRLQE